MPSPELQRQQELEDLGAVLSLPAGLRFVTRLIRLSNYLGASYAPGDALATAYNEGLRRMGGILAAETAITAPDKLGNILNNPKGAKNG